MVLKLAYCGLGVADVAAWVSFAVNALGFELVEGDGVPKLRIDDRAWRFAVHEAPGDDIAYAGYEVKDEAELTRLRERLQAAGIGHEDLNKQECSDRQITNGIWLHDPDGLRLECVVGHAEAATPFQSDLVGAFVTGEEGLGHIVVSTENLDRETHFFETLGFKLSDYITVPMGPDQTLRIAFMHCNPRHHSLAFAQLPGSKRLNHIMVEVKTVDDVLQGYQRCLRQGYRTGNIGRHPNDLMLSFYVKTPAGFDIEYGCDGRRIEGEWSVGEYDQISLWGHEPAA